MGILSLTLGVACGPMGERAIPFGARVDSANGRAIVAIAGLTRKERQAVTGDSAGVVRVSVLGGEPTAIVGKYLADDRDMLFYPQFEFDAGRSYVVVLNRDGQELRDTVTFPDSPFIASTRVARILPTADTLPANLLRLYVEFSKPMSNRSGVGLVHLLDENGVEVPAAFLPLDADFWNEDRTRFTVFLDPGRVKRGILPNEEMGRALEPGHRYSIVVDSIWPDEHGFALLAPFKKSFVAGKPVEKPLSIDPWTLSGANEGTTDALVVRFPTVLDHGLLRRALGVEDGSGRRVEGTVSITPGEREWHFTPSSPWRRGNYKLIVLSVLEDPMGNRIGKAFEVDRFERADSSSVPERFTIPFTVR